MCGLEISAESNKKYCEFCISETTGNQGLGRSISRLMTKREWSLMLLGQYTPESDKYCEDYL